MIWDQNKWELELQIVYRSLFWPKDCVEHSVENVADFFVENVLEYFVAEHVANGFVEKLDERLVEHFILPNKCSFFLPQ